MREVTVKDICTIKSGKRLPKGTDFAEGVTKHPYIRARDIKDGQIHTDELVYIDDSVFEKIQRYIINTGDIAITVVGASIGDVGYATQEIDGYNLTENAVRLTDFNEDVNSKYVFYYLNSDLGQTYMRQVAGGAAQPKLGIYKVESIPLVLPKRETQDKISDILSQYDELIENNQKQIKLLEEAAQRLYKEWFVDLRFPGYEETEIVDGIPEGWKRTTIGEFLGVRSGYAFKSGWWQDSGYPVVKIKDISNNTIDVSSLDHVAPEHTSKIPEFKLNKGDIVIAMTGATIGKIGLVPEVDNLYTNQRVGKVFPNVELLNPTPFVFCYYAQQSILEQIVALSSSSSAQPNISGGQLESFEIIANIDIINMFGKNVQPHFDKINELYKQNRLLIQARDRLLPKLMSGEIEV